MFLLVYSFYERGIEKEESVAVISTIADSCRTCMSVSCHPLY